MAKYSHIPGNPPSLGDLVEAHGGYHRIPPEAWAAYDAAVAEWQQLHRTGALWEPPYRNIQKEAAERRALLAEQRAKAASAEEEFQAWQKRVRNNASHPDKN